MAEIWGSSSWDHWPIGWIYSQGQAADDSSSKLYPKHFSPLGMDFFALPDQEEEGGVYYSLISVAEDTLEQTHRVGRPVVTEGKSGDR